MDRVLGLGLGAFALWLLLFAPTLQHNAQVSPVGTRRTVALRILAPIAATSRALQLSRIVSEDRCADRAHREPPGRRRRHHRARAPAPPPAADPTRRPGTASGRRPRPPRPRCPTSPIPSAAAPAARPDRRGLARHRHGWPAAERPGHHRGGDRHPRCAGEHRADPARLLQLAAAAAVRHHGLSPPDRGGHDGGQRPPGLPGPTRRALQLTGVGGALRQRVSTFMQIAASGGATVIWVGMPPMQNAGLSPGDDGHQRHRPDPGGPRRARRSTSSAPPCCWARPRAPTPRSSPTRPARWPTCVPPTASTSRPTAARSSHNGCSTSCAATCTSSCPEAAGPRPWWSTAWPP